MFGFPLTSSESQLLHCFTFDSKVLFPKEVKDQTMQKDAQNGESVRRGGLNGQYEVFTEVNLSLQEQLKDLILNGTVYNSAKLSLSNIHRCKKKKDRHL